MSDPAPPTFDDEALAHLRSLPAFRIDPDLREWRAPEGVLGGAAGLAASFRALKMRSVIESPEDGSLRFEAWRNPRVSGALLASALGGALYVALSAAEIQTFAIVAVVVVAAFYVPIALLPSYRVSGKIAGGRVQVRLHVRGLLGRRTAFESRLRFYLER
jgi:hypothetical protein